MSYHNGLRSLLVLIGTLAVWAAGGCSGAGNDTPAESAMNTLVTTEWLSEHLADPNLVVLDCTVRMEPGESGGMRMVSGRPDYESGHIPSAGFADLKGELSDAESPLGFTLPTPEEFCAAMGALGVGNGSRVVLYDNFNSVWASRVWWMLRWVGFDQAALLDGGLKAWTAEGRPVSTEPAAREAKELTPRVRPQLVAYKDEVSAAIEDDAVSIIDVMPEAHYRGEMTMYARPGHIPSAVNVSSMALFDSSGHFRPQAELDAMFAFAGDRAARAITYCGAGIAASANAFVMTRLGFTDVAVYMGSLQEWAADPANPLVVGGAEATPGTEPSSAEEQRSQTQPTN